MATLESVNRVRSDAPAIAWADRLRERLLAAAAQLALPWPSTEAEATQGDAEERDRESLLEHGPRTPSDQELLEAAFATSLAREDSLDSPISAQLIEQLCWLHSHAGFSPWNALDLAGTAEQRAALWAAVGEATLAEPGTTPSAQQVLNRVTASWALSRSRCSEAEQIRDSLLERVESLALPHEILVAAPASRVSGVAAPAPARPWVTLLLALSTLLFFARLGRFVARWLLGYRHPATLRLGPEGLQWSEHVEILGRPIRSRRLEVPLEQLVAVEREARFARAGLYLGLVSLVLGTFMGVGLLVDGLRVSGTSPTLMVLGLLLIVGGAGLDFALSALDGAGRQRCRLIVAPRRGRRLCLSHVDARSADEMLTALAGRLGEPRARQSSR